MTLDTLLRHDLLLATFAVVALAVLALVIASTWIIGENESGLVIKKYGPPLAAGRLIALDGEAGYQARLLPPGWHFVPFRWQYRVVKVPMVVVPPGEIALVVAADGAPIPTERMLGREVACDDFQDAEAFLRSGGERGRQLGVPDRGHLPHQPGAVPGRHRAQRRASTAWRPAQLRVRQVPADTVGIVTALDGRPIPAGDLAGPPVEGHDSFQRGQAFIEAGGCRGLQEEVLLAGSWNLNPWFVQVELMPMTEIPIGYVGVVVSYVGKEHVDVSGETFTHGDLVERGRKGVWVEPLLPGKHPLNTRGDEGGAGADHQHRPQLGGPDRGAHVRRQPVVDPRALEGRVLVQPGRRADDPHRREERPARDLARRVDAEPGRPRAAADGRQLLPQLGAGGDACWSSCRRAASGSARRKEAIRDALSRRTTSSASTR